MFLSKASNGNYYVYYTKSDGKRTRISTKTKKKSEAIKFVSEFEKNIKIRQLTETIPISLKKFSWEFLKYSESNHSPNTTYAIKIIFKQFIIYCGDSQLININERMVKEYIQLKSKVSNYTAQKHLAHLRRAFNFAMQYKYVLENPFRNITNYKMPEKQPLFFDHLSFQVLLQVIDDDDFRDIVEFAVHTGLRQMEILTLDWEQIDIKNRLLTLTNRKYLTKSKKIRTVPLNLTALQILTKREVLKKSDYIFGKEGIPYKQDFVSKKFKKYIRRTNLNQAYKFHSLRHTFASWLVQNGVPLYNVSKLLGHADIKTTQIYVHVSASELTNAVMMLD
ncbi:MAG: site-specific integrase [Bacteroidota bacterium]